MIPTPPLIRQMSRETIRPANCRMRIPIRPREYHGARTGDRRRRRRDRGRGGPLADLVATVGRWRWRCGRSAGLAANRGSRSRLRHRQSRAGLRAGNDRRRSLSAIRLARPAGPDQLLGLLVRTLSSRGAGADPRPRLARVRWTHDRRSQYRGISLCCAQNFVSEFGSNMQSRWTSMARCSARTAEADRTDRRVPFSSTRMARSCASGQARPRTTVVEEHTRELPSHMRLAKSGSSPD